MQQKTKPMKIRYLYLLLVLASASIINFIRYESLNLNSDSPSFPTFFVDYEEKARHEPWSVIVEKEQDAFITKIANNQKEFMINWGLYNFCNFPAHLFYKVFNLRGAKLWVAHKLMATCMGIGTVLVVFLIADLFYGPLVGLIAGVLMAFSPHVWVLYNFSADAAQPYNLFLSLLTVYFFLLFVKHKKWYFVLISGFFIGTNFLFFHVGSFLIPVIIFIFCVYKSITEKKPIWLIWIFIIALIAIFSVVSLSYLHSSYMKLSYNSIIKYIKDYASWGPTASHTVYGLVFLNWKKLILNSQHHIQGVFINGRTEDWHHGSSLPSIPMVYNYLISILFISACVIYILRRERKDAFLFIWFLAYFFVYSVVVFVRQKNIIGEIPPIFILAASTIPVISSFAHTKIRKFSENIITYCLALILVISSVAIGSYRLFWYLPTKNFYGAYKADYEAYQYFRLRGYTRKTKIILTSTEGVPASNMVFRLFTEGIPKIFNLTDFDIHPTNEVNDKNIQKLSEVESSLIKDSDKIFYCFNYFDDHMWATYSDEYFRNIFLKNHPGAVSFDIKGLDGKVVWRIYKIGI